MLQGLSGVASTGAGQAATDSQQLDDDLNRFLTLLVTQLQNQDPLDPLDANEFTQQLVQFANVEQQIYQNSHLENLVELQQGSQISSLVNYLGTMIETAGNALPLENGQATATYTLADNVKDTAITVTNEFGDVVYVGEGESRAGRHVFEWDGRDALGNQFPDGNYTIEVGSTATDGSLVDVAVTTFGRATGATVEEGQAFLIMGGAYVPMDSVLSVHGNNQPQKLESETSS